MSGELPPSMALRWWYGAFDDLPRRELYELLRLREAVFVVEQDCVYQDADGRDLEAHHLLGFDGSALAACLRVLPLDAAHPDVAIGRVAVAPSHRGVGLGWTLMRRGIDCAQRSHGPVPLFVSAQSHLRSFYERLGFAVCGEGYLEDGIPHLPMRRVGSADAEAARAG